MNNIKHTNLLIWPGGKRFMLKHLIPILENIEHDVFVDAFGGSAKVLLAKKPVEFEVYNDINSHLYDLFCVMRDPHLFERFQRIVETLPYSRQLRRWCFENMQHDDVVERAWRFWLVNVQGFYGKIDLSSWRFSLINHKPRTFQKRKLNLPFIHERLKYVYIEHYDALKILALYDSPSTLFYLDPPYVLSTRKDLVYQHEMSDADHERLIARVLTLKGKCALSGYDSALYAPLEAAGWRKLTFSVTLHMDKVERGETKQSRQEVLWLSPNCDVKEKRRLL